jgi:hypothetical protein
MNTMKNTWKEAALPLLTTQTMLGSGVCRAMLRGRSSGLKGADASRLRPAGRPALDPGDLGGPWGSKCGQARACPGGRHGTPIATCGQDQESSNYKIEVSTVPGDGHGDTGIRLAGGSAAG